MFHYKSDVSSRVGKGIRLDEVAVDIAHARVIFREHAVEKVGALDVEHRPVSMMNSRATLLRSVTMMSLAARSGLMLRTETTCLKLGRFS